MGDFEALASAGVESSVKYHPYSLEILTYCSESCVETVSDGQFNWGGFLQKGIGGVQRFPQLRRQWSVERKGIRELNCDPDKGNRCESRA